MNKIKIMVDSMPNKPTECLFCEHEEIRDDNYSYGYVYTVNYCSLSKLTKNINNHCCLEQKGYCPYLYGHV
jgi:hypothetical protein